MIDEYTFFLARNSNPSNIKNFSLYEGKVELDRVDRRMRPGEAKK